MSKYRLPILYILLFFILLGIFALVLFHLNHMEQFSSVSSTGTGYHGQKVNKKMNPRFDPNSHWISYGYPGDNYLGVAKIPKNYVPYSDDQPVSYGYGGNTSKLEIPFTRLNPLAINRGFAY